MPALNGATYVPDPQETSQYSDFSRFRADSPRAAANSTGYRSTAATSRPRRERGVPHWMALIVLLVIAGVGGLIDQISGASVQGAFNWSLILASLVAIVIVRRSQMFPIVIAPPLVYFLASGFKLYITSNGLKNKSALTNYAANWLVYGFPAIAGATAIVLLVAGIRMIARR